MRVRPFQMFQEPHVLQESGSVPPCREDKRGPRFPPIAGPLSVREHLPQCVPTQRSASPADADHEPAPAGSLAYSESRNLGAPEPAAEEHRQDRAVAQALSRGGIWGIQQRLRLPDS